MTFEEQKRIFSANLKSAMKSKDISKLQLANKLGYSLDTISKYTSAKAPQFPPLEIMGIIAKELNVDVAYLLGEIDCKKVSAQRLQDITNLSTKSSNTLSELCKNDIYKEMLDSLFSSDYIKIVLTDLYQYLHCHNKRVYVNDMILKEEELYTDKPLQKIYKSSALDSYGKMIEELFNNNDKSANEMFALTYFKEMLELIDSLVSDIGTEETYYNEETEELTTCKLSHEEIVNTVNNYLKPLQEMSNDKLYHQPATFYIENIKQLIATCNSNTTKDYQP